MEFYATYAYSFLLVAHLVSIPTGWNSTIMQLSAYDDDISFNSQRDGILRNFFKNKTEQSQRFQFPMGWNSTQSRSLFYSYGKVSIPNGMEFYHSVKSIFRRGRRVSIPNGMEFYSDSYISHSTYGTVSIPNGMEFYEVDETPRQSKVKSFNSQRDGILPFPWKSRSRRSIRFQFPTGWNSTLTDGFYYVFKKKFQFPTGWNST